MGRGGVSWGVVLVVSVLVVPFCSSREKEKRRKGKKGGKMRPLLCFIKNPQKKE